ncbi:MULTISPECIES: ATP-binding protein [Nostocales]|uniref:ATPase n=3 Tax=Nostocales TaxID=1161 RepID=A0A0C1MW98_9CYAN|nr:anti-sigma regulatory factor [Tolypothrix bouteillei]KAF3890137.1 anti-sigma regulatory factor [Tolypothrix bouteillei VB521301]
MNSKFFLKTYTGITDYAQVLSWFDTINQPSFLDTRIWWQCQTLLIEGLINIVEHAHKNLSPETPIEIEVVRSEKNIEIRIVSYGQPFDLEQKLQETTELEENDEERGRGLRIMAALADELRYEPTADNRYCLLMRKYY